MNEFISCFFFFLLVKMEDFNTPIWNWIQRVDKKKTGKDIEAMNNAISIFDYIIVAIYVGRFKFTK